MIYVAQTHVMNGTVTMDTGLMGIEADTFEDAKAILKDKVETIVELEETEKDISFEIPQPEPGPFKAFVRMYDKPLEIFKAREPRQPDEDWAKEQASKLDGSSEDQPECEGCPNEGECSHKQLEAEIKSTKA